MNDIPTTPTPVLPDEILALNTPTLRAVAHQLELHAQIIRQRLLVVRDGSDAIACKAQVAQAEGIAKGLVELANLIETQRPLTLTPKED